MDPLLNPYRPGAGTPPPTLAGRGPELDAIANLIARLAVGRGERSVVLTGLRGVGKTALLWAAEGKAENRGWIAPSLEARAGLDFRAALADRAWVILRQLEHKRRDVGGDSREQAVESLGGKAHAQQPAGGTTT